MQAKFNYFKHYDGRYSISFDEARGVREIVVPSEHEGSAVYAITRSEEPLYDLEKITIPESITYIGERAFESCGSLDEITIPSSVSSIGEGAFLYCTSLLIYCEIPCPTQKFNESWNHSKCPVVWNCKNNDVADDGFIYVTAGGVRYGIKDGYARAVKLVKNVADVSILDKITYKGVDYEVREISEYAFFSFNKIETIHIPASVKKIGASAFFNCHNLRGVYITDLSSWCEISFEGSDETNPLYHAKHLYLNGELLSELEIPEGVVEIKAAAFRSLEVSAVRIPSSVRSIETIAFKGCDSLDAVYIPASVEKIGLRAFEYCHEMTAYCEACEKPEGWDESWASDWTDVTRPVVWNYKNNDVATDGNIYTVTGGVRFAIKDGSATVVKQRACATEIIIPESITYNSVHYPVTAIQEHAMSYSSSLTKVYIPSSVISVGASVFPFSSDLHILCKPQEKPVGWDEDWNRAECTVVWGVK